MQFSHPGSPRPTPGDGRESPEIVLVKDEQDCIPLSKSLQEGEVVVLLTPLISPDSATHGGDPFEPLGRALAAFHPWIRHVPYTPRNGITSTHVGFIKRSKVVLFVVTGPPTSGQPSQVDFAEVVRAIGDDRPHIILACCEVKTLDFLEDTFPTIVQLSGCSREELEAAAALLLGSYHSGGLTHPEQPSPIPKSWAVETWDEFDVSPIQNLWRQSLPAKFHLDSRSLVNLLKRDGYAMHYVVRLPRTSEIVGFCATYTTYADSEGEALIGSLGLVLVAAHHRGRGIGLSLHEHALRQLTRTRGVQRIQVGSTFPRLLCGIPSDSASEGWWQRRGWQLDYHSPGKGEEICDWFLKFEDWPVPTGGFPSGSAGLMFRRCEFTEYELVIDLVEKESTRKDNMGWYDQYAKLANTMAIRDVILGLEGENIIATALTYTAHSESGMADDLPWACTLGSDVGGVTCICIPDGDAKLTNSKNTVMIRLLDACITALKEQGMNRAFLDGVKGGSDGFQSIGFQKWASYRDVWRRV